MNTHFPSHPRSTPFRVDWKVYLSARDTPTSAKVLKKVAITKHIQPFYSLDFQRLFSNYNFTPPICI